MHVDGLVCTAFRSTPGSSALNLTPSYQAAQTQLNKQISDLKSEVKALRQSVKKAENERDAHSQDLQQVLAVHMGTTSPPCMAPGCTLSRHSAAFERCHPAPFPQTNNVLTALRLEQESSPVPASVVLFFAKLRPLQKQALALWTAKVQPLVSLALDRASHSFSHVRGWVASQASPAWNKALLRGGALASDLHTRLASHETLGAHYVTLQRHASSTWSKARVLQANAGSHATLAAKELETLLATQLRRYPSLAPLAVNPYPAVIVKGLLWLPLVRHNDGRRASLQHSSVSCARGIHCLSSSSQVALVLSLVGAGKGKHSRKSPQNGTPRSAKKHKVSRAGNTASHERGSMRGAFRVRG